MEEEQREEEDYRVQGTSAFPVPDRKQYSLTVARYKIKEWG